MNSIDYRFVFDDITGKKSTVQMMDSRSQQKNWFAVDLEDEALLFTGEPITSLEADILDLALAIYTADRLSVREGDTQCLIDITLPVRNHLWLDRPEILDSLSEVLYWYTEDTWQIHFVERKRISRIAERQLTIGLEFDSKLHTEVALFSGGLDSLAGFCTRYRQHPNVQYLLLGTGGNSQKFELQRRVFSKMRTVVKPNAHLIQIPIGVNNSTDLSKSVVQRTRGFVFTLIGTVCARVARVNKLYIYENGIGAINLPFRNSEVGLDHSRAVHPLSLLKMSNLASLLLDTEFKFENPFLFWTKAQMCEVFRKEAWRSLIFETVSCDSMHRDIPSQCGYCSSCLLRRQAIEANNITDNTRYVIEKRDIHTKLTDSLHLRSMLDQIKTFRQLLNLEHPWEHFTWEYTELASIVDQISFELTDNPIEKFISLYTTYLAEWVRVLPSLGRSLLEDEEFQTYRAA